MTMFEIYELINEEIRRAEKKFPIWPAENWPTKVPDAARIEEAAIICEESGEVLKAALDMRAIDPHKEKVTEEDYMMEIVQTAAMCIRALKRF